MAAPMANKGPLTSTAAISLLDGGECPAERDLIRLLRAPACPAALVERLAACRWVLRERRVLPLVIRHPACPRSFALEAAGRVGWRDLLEVARDPRAAPLIRRQAERKVLDRIPQMALGERIALARFATRTVFPGLFASADVPCVQALLDNAQFTESDAVRLVQVNECGACVLALVRHPRWGAAPGVVRAALRHRGLPMGIALGLLASIGSTDLADLAAATEVSEGVKAAAQQLIQRRERAEDSA